MLARLVNYYNFRFFPAAGRGLRTVNLHQFELVEYMAVVFTPLSWWVSSGKQQEPRRPGGPSLNPCPSETGSWDSDTLKFPLSKHNVSSSSRNEKRKWKSREERKIDREYDIVLVPPDAGCMSGSESDDSDWSIGWLEPHGPEFQNDDGDDDSDGSFAVLVPCYGRVRDDSVDDPKSKLVAFSGNITEFFPADGANNYLEQWLSSLQNS